MLLSLQIYGILDARVLKLCQWIFQKIKKNYKQEFSQCNNTAHNERMRCNGVETHDFVLNLCHYVINSFKKIQEYTI